jgi:hypothetical protein
MWAEKKFILFCLNFLLNKTARNNKFFFRESSSKDTQYKEYAHLSWLDLDAAFLTKSWRGNDIQALEAANYRVGERRRGDFVYIA